MPVSPDQVAVIAVASGKGGVGKTTVAVNVALALGGQPARAGDLGPRASGPHRGRPGRGTIITPPPTVIHRPHS